MLPLGLADMRRRDTTSSLVGCVLLGGVVSGRGADPDQSTRLYGQAGADLADDVGWGGGYIYDDGVRRLLEGFELTLQKFGVHVVTSSVKHPLMD